MLYLALGAFFIALVIAGIAQYQKRDRKQFYTKPQGTDVPFEGPDPPVSPKGLPLNHP
jgi:hypothetical protein